MVQRLLELQANRTGIAVVRTGRYDRAKQAAVEVFQRPIMPMTAATGVVVPRDATLRSMNLTVGRPMAGVATDLRLTPRVGDSVLQKRGLSGSGSDVGLRSARDQGGNDGGGSSGRV